MNLLEPLAVPWSNRRDQRQNNREVVPQKADNGRGWLFSSRPPAEVRGYEEAAARRGGAPKLQRETTSHARKTDRCAQLAERVNRRIG